MRPLLLSGVAVLATLISVSAFAVDRNVTLVNNTGRGIEFVGFNPPGDEEWTDNEISRILDDGNSVYVKFNEADHRLHMERQDRLGGRSVIGAARRSEPLLSIDEVTLSYDASTGEASYEAEVGGNVAESLRADEPRACPCPMTSPERSSSSPAAAAASDALLRPPSPRPARRLCWPRHRRRISRGRRARSRRPALGGRPSSRAICRTIEACEAVFRAVSERHGRCDILVNSAGATRAGSFVDLPDAVWQDGFALKFFACVRLSRLFWPMLTSSQGPRRQHHRRRRAEARRRFPHRRLGQCGDGQFQQGAFGPRQERRRQRQRHPPGPHGDRPDRRPLPAEGRSARRHPAEIEAEEAAKDGLQRIGQPEDIAALTLFLCSEAARHIQGTAIAVDGGATPGLY